MLCNMLCNTSAWCNTSRCVICCVIRPHGVMQRRVSLVASRLALVETAILRDENALRLQLSARDRADEQRPTKVRALAVLLSGGHPMPARSLPLLTHPMQSHLKPSQPIPPHLTPFHPPPLLIPSHSIQSNHTPTHPTPAQPIWSLVLVSPVGWHSVRPTSPA